MEHLRNQLAEIVDEQHPIGVRGVAYVAVGRRLIVKVEGEFKNVGHLLVELRRDGRIPREWIVDGTRRTNLSSVYSSPAEVIRESLDVYRRDIWEGQESRVEVFCEKAGIAPVLQSVADPLCVPTSPFHGDSSNSFLYEIAKRIQDDGRPTHVLYFGDHDPSGIGIEKVAIRKIREWAPDVDLHVERIAVTPEQIVTMNLPTRPTKHGNRERDFEGESVEVDAIPPRALRELAEVATLRHLDMTKVKKIRQAETRERKALENLVADFESSRP